MAKQKTEIRPRVTVITGASSGIGLSMAQLMATQGDIVYDLSRRENQITGIRHIHCDVTDRDTIAAAVSSIMEQEGRIDTLVLAAGMGIAGALEFMSERDMQYQMDVNLYGVIRVVQAVLPVMRAQELNAHGERGRIVMVSSMAAEYPVPYQTMYSVSKSGLCAFAFGLRNEVFHHHIGVTCVLPGDVKTGFTSVRRTNWDGKEEYPMMESAVRKMEEDEENGLPADLVARRIVNIANKKNPDLYYSLDAKSAFQRFMYSVYLRNASLWFLRKLYRC